MSQTSFDWLFYHDGAPEWDEYLHADWDMAPGTSIRDQLLEVKHWTENQPRRTAYDWFQSFFTEPQNEIEDGSGASTHADGGRPRLDASGGRARPSPLCQRHGIPLRDGWCPRC